MSYIQVKNASKIYGEGENKVVALDNVSMSVEKGEFAAVVGASGSGKSTLLHIIGGIDTSTSGEVIIDGSKISDMNDKELSLFRRKNIGFIFQSFNLVPILNVRDNILLPIKLNNEAADENYINEIIEKLDLGDRLLHYPNQLSGGQQQRVAIARALANKPAVILADEPTGNLDSKTSENVVLLLKKFNRLYGQTIIMITHDNNIAEEADRIFTIKDGCITNEKRGENK